MSSQSFYFGLKYIKNHSKFYSGPFKLLKTISDGDNEIYQHYWEVNCITTGKRIILVSPVFNQKEFIQKLHSCDFEVETRLKEDEPPHNLVDDTRNEISSEQAV